MISPMWAVLWAVSGIPGILFMAKDFGRLTLLMIILGMLCGPVLTCVGVILVGGEVVLWERKEK